MTVNSYGSFYSTEEAMLHTIYYILRTLALRFVRLLESTTCFHNSTMSGKQQAFLGGTVVHKELRSLRLYQGCHQKGGSVTKAMLDEASIGQQYFGDAKIHDSISVSHFRFCYRVS
jgi:hypothetical protein